VLRLLRAILLLLGKANALTL